MDEIVKSNGTILVVMGGKSTEREVSLRSGEAIYNALKEKKYNVKKFILNHDNVSEILKINPEFVFIALHGKGGEDGSIQGMLELAGISYSGSGVASSAICMDKILSKKMFVYHNIITPKFIVWNGKLNVEDINLLEDNIVETLGFPVVVKATSQGSSVGVKIVYQRERLTEVIRELYLYDNALLFEEYIDGRELTIPIMLYQGQLKVFPIIEIVSENTFYDYESKYTQGMSRHIVPASLSQEVEKRIVEMSKKIYTEFGCQGIVRIDFMLNKNEIPYAIEVNTLPGMTETSLVPDAANAMGMSFNDLCEIIMLSTKR